MFSQTVQIATVLAAENECSPHTSFLMPHKMDCMHCSEPQGPKSTELDAPQKGLFLPSFLIAAEQPRRRLSSISVPCSLWPPCSTAEAQTSQIGALHGHWKTSLHLAEAKDFAADVLMVSRHFHDGSTLQSQALPYICLTILSSSGSCSLRAAIIRASSDTDT